MNSMNNKQAEQIRHIEQWRASGLSQVEYSRRNELKPATFNYWVRHLDAEASAVRPLSPSRAGFLPVSIDKVAEPAAHALLLRTRQGYTLELSTSTSPRWLAELLQCLD
ncbi:IS66 family insertion sequence element accessory protein TnpB [Candidatus Methylospira mobilis]|uniref:IS66 family insertion sequence element accessory protein TnpB n=1 Tax=Candidatus Methylospira mobilis TaxID=1808979 RepID=A0A5Q0BI60_9GAMM|nr:IS66 family insertion sequence element accessory protein TnpB [Candidatus Methylospira mobilis]QFY43249.1 IS66 family insertion sequence element accessory protein TnpB [Candidatus Methylospira mobilis]QFY43383.1 IS66 family insertion sequence element accessory protein TnpB [Candidatus Methylospira mobilis]QFY43709.1 IS66 family insertion sequence element accessory protein TnpB [Candidatus Methylospira mobilis]QFY43933.1 IS66 family insertion sequence element accessory protein TnpB [Candidatu